MRRDRKRRGASSILNLDSLMDILSCLVGVMLFLVIYTVLELGSATYQADMPVIRDLPDDGERIVVLAEEGTIKLLDLRAARARLLSGFEIVRSFAEVPVFVDGIEGDVTDQYFRYGLSYEERLSVDLLGTLDLTIDARPDAVGDSIHQLETGSYASHLARLDPADTWLVFAVDPGSVDVFRRAREMAVDRGFAIRWDPGMMQLPVTLALGVDGDDEFNITGTLDKPLR